MGKPFSLQRVTKFLAREEGGPRDSSTSIELTFDLDQWKLLRLFFISFSWAYNQNKPV